MVSGRDIVVVGASAGGVRALQALLGKLPSDLPAAVLVVLHVPATGGSSLPRILGRAGPLPAARAVDGERIRPGLVYVAPPDRHLLVIKDILRLSRGPRQNGVRPAADTLFRSAALYAGPRTTAVVLSGTLDDAALGAATVERRGGAVLVQDPDEADYDGMPRSALAVTSGALVAPAADLAAHVVQLATGDTGILPPDAEQPDEELAAEISGLLTGALETNTPTRVYSGLSCPECDGPLYVAHEDRAVTCDCFIGHRWSPTSPLEGQGSSVERALWLAIRSLEDRGRLTARLAHAARERGHPLSAGHFSQAAEEAQRSADALRVVADGLVTPVASELGQA